MRISIHAPLAGRDLLRQRYGGGLQISIHAPLAGRDWSSCRVPCRATYFNPRAPCGARRLLRAIHTKLAGFQSTRPLRGATAARGQCPRSSSDFNPRAPCGARLFSLRSSWLGGCISIHAPLAGRDALHTEYLRRELVFQSTRPLRGATLTNRLLSPIMGIFQSTRPLRGATDLPHVQGPLSVISIHAPLAGRDRSGMAILDGSGDFNPRAPCGARLLRLPGRTALRTISIHAPLAGRDE